jgi:hypothetical protein
MITLYVYVDGYDLAELETDLVKRFADFVAAWNISTARVVNIRRQPSADLQEGDLPEWNLGLNFTVDRLPREKIQELVRFLSGLARETGRDFVIGSGGEDWFSIGSEPRGNVVEQLAEQIG